MGGSDHVELPEELRGLLEETSVPELINGLVGVKQHVSSTTFCPVIFSSIDFWVALGRVDISQKKMLTDVSWCPPFITGTPPNGAGPMAGGRGILSKSL